MHQETRGGHPETRESQRAAPHDSDAPGGAGTKARSGPGAPSVKGDVRAIQNRVDSVEHGVTAQMEKTLKMLDKITDNYSNQAKALGELKDTQDKFQKRLEALELKPQFSSAPGSTADTDGGGGKPPALILGGWHPDQAAEDTLRAARDILRTLDVQLNAEDMFVPGVRRGYAIIPIKPRAFEDDTARRARVPQAISRIRNANLTTGRDEKGDMRKL